MIANGAASALGALGASGQSSRWQQGSRQHLVLSVLLLGESLLRQQGTAFFIGSGNCTFHSHYRCQEHGFHEAKKDLHCLCVADALFSGFDQFTGSDHPVDQFRNPFTGIKNVHGNVIAKPSCIDHLIILDPDLVTLEWAGGIDRDYRY